jgi:hypothetical protein
MGGGHLSVGCSLYFSMWNNNFLSIFYHRRSNVVVQLVGVSIVWRSDSPMVVRLVEETGANSWIWNLNFSNAGRNSIAFIFVVDEDGGVVVSGGRADVVFSVWRKYCPMVVCLMEYACSNSWIWNLNSVVDVMVDVASVAIVVVRG